MYNPTRRNRNIGTAKQGYGANNKLVIPYPCAVAKSFFARIGPYDKEIKVINGKEFIFVIERTIGDFRHACSVNDVEYVLQNVPTADLTDLKLIVMRQPKRKENILSPVWGRLIYSYEFEKENHPAIIIEAIDFTKKLSWLKSQQPEAQAEFKRLQDDGHKFDEDKRFFTAPFVLDTVRNTQLYRTLLHEIGHYVHYLEFVERPSLENEDFEDWEKRLDDYFKISSSDKERYAHKYATELYNALKQIGILPFK